MARNTETLSVSVATELYAAIKALAERERRPMSVYLREWIADGMERVERTERAEKRERGGA